MLLFFCCRCCRFPSETKESGGEMVKQKADYYFKQTTGKHFGFSFRQNVFVFRRFLVFFPPLCRFVLFPPLLKKRLISAKCFSLPPCVFFPHRAVATFSSFYLICIHSLKYKPVLSSERRFETLKKCNKSMRKIDQKRKKIK